MPTWSQCLTAMVLLALTGFSFVIAGGYWHLLALLSAAAALLVWLHHRNSRVNPTSTKKGTPP